MCVCGFNKLKYTLKLLSVAVDNMPSCLWMVKYKEGLTEMSQTEALNSL